LGNEEFGAGGSRAATPTEEVAESWPLVQERTYHTVQIGGYLVEYDGDTMTIRLGQRILFGMAYLFVGAWVAYMLAPFIPVAYSIATDARPLAAAHHLLTRIWWIWSSSLGRTILGIVMGEAVVGLLIFLRFAPIVKRRTATTFTKGAPGYVDGHGKLRAATRDLAIVIEKAGRRTHTVRLAPRTRSFRDEFLGYEQRAWVLSTESLARDLAERINDFSGIPITDNRHRRGRQ